MKLLVLVLLLYENLFPVDGDFEVELKFGDLAVKEKRRKKQEVKKEAALKMLKKIRDIQELENHFFQVSPPSSGKSLIKSISH